MNKGMHRVIWSAARAMRVVVQETASGGGASSKATSGTGARARAPARAAVAVALFGVLVTPHVEAQLVGAPNVPGSLRPTVLMAPNGVPLINIRTPSAAGVSRNVYSQFNVAPNGAILNNSRTHVQTQLGGFVAGNPSLARGPARIILNEVNGGSPSQLSGYIEVAGQRAEVIIANPAGIGVSGGGFINASRATLTTGTPQFDAMGGLDSFLVRGGTVSIDGAGLDAGKTDYAAILARAVRVNAGIWANELKVVAGANQVSADHSLVMPTAGNGTAPAFALDVAALGGMYANHIFLTGTEAGLGVRNAGSIGARNGDLIVTAAGRLENTGTLEGTRVELASAGDIDNRNGGTIRQVGGVDLTISAPTLSNANGGVIGVEPLPAATTGSGDDGGTSARGTSPGVPTAGMGPNPGSSGTVSPAPAPYVPPSPGTIAAAGALRNDGGRIYAGGPVALQTSEINNAGGTLSVASMAVSGPTFSNAGGTLNVSRSFGANVGSFDNTGGKLNAGHLAITTTGDLFNTDGTLASATDANLSVGDKAENTRGTISAVGALTASVAGATTNGAGTLASNQGLTLKTRSLDNARGSIQSAQSGVQLTVADQLENGSGGTIGAATNLGVQAGSLANGGSLRGANDTHVAVGGAMANNGSITAGRDTTIAAGSLEGGNTSVFGAGIRNDGKLGSTGDLRVTSTGMLVAHGSNLAAGSATLQGTSVDLSASRTSATHIAVTATQGDVSTGRAMVVAAGTLRVAAAGALDNTGGTIASNGNASIKAASLNNNAGSVTAVGDLLVNAGTIQNTGGLVRSLATTRLNAESIVNTPTPGADQGIEGKDVAIAVGNLNNTSGAIRADVNATIASGGTVTNTNGLISAGHMLSIADPNRADPAAKTLSVVNTGGTLVAGTATKLGPDGRPTAAFGLLEIDARDFSGDGKAVGVNDLRIALAQDVTNNAEVKAGGHLSYATIGRLTNNGKLLAGGIVTASGNELVNTANGEMTGDTTVVNAASTLTNRGLIDGRNTQINGGTVDNLGTGRIYGDALSIAAGTLTNDTETVGGVARAGTIAARDTLNIGVGTLNNREHALLFSAADLFIGGSLDAQRQASARGGTLNNESATIEALGDMTIAMGQINNIDTHLKVATRSSTQSIRSLITMDGKSWSPLDTVGDPGTRLVYHRAADGAISVIGKGWTDAITTIGVTEDSATHADPARIVAGANLRIDGHVYNRDSQVMAGRELDAPDVNNQATEGRRDTTTSALWIGYNPNRPGKPPEDPRYIPATTQTQTYKLTDYKPLAHQQNATQGYDVGAAGRTAVGDAASGTGSVRTHGSETGGIGSQTIPMVARTGAAPITIPQPSLFSLSTGSRYLIETDPRFANYRQWLGSDYLLSKLGLDPHTTLKRLGDGFYEQRLIREQVAQLTGYRYLDGFSSDDDQYTALMNAGATFARQYGLRPGIALSAAQMAQLTSDIVWLVEQTVTLPDGSPQRVLVPQVYVRVRPGDIDGNGALLSADALKIKGAGGLVNTGTLAGRSLVKIDAESINNLGGRISGGSLGIHARSDLNSVGGTFDARDAAVLTAGRDIDIRTTTQTNGPSTRVDRVAGAYVSNPGGTLIASAGRDANLVGAALVSAGSVAMGAGRNIDMGTVTEGHTIAFANRNIAGVSSASREIGSVIQGQDSVRLAAGNDLNIRAGAAASVDGALVATAKNDINVTAGQSTNSVSSATQRSSKSLFKKSSASSFDSTSTTDVLSGSLSGKSVALVAGNDVNLQAAQLSSQDAMSLSAGRDINLTTANRTTQELHAAQSRSSGTALGRFVAAAAFSGDATAVAAAGNAKSSNQNEASISTQAVGTSLSAGSLQTVSGRDTTLQAATVVADNDITMMAGRNLGIENAQNTNAQTRYDANSKSGMVGQWYNPAIGNIKGSQANATTRTTQQASQVASLQGNVTLVAGNEYRQTASSVMATGQAGPLAGGDVNILAKNVVINEAYNTTQSVSMDKSSSTIVGGSASFMGVGTDTIKGASSTIKAMGNTGGDARMQALGAANLAMSGKQAYDAVQAIGGTGQMSYGVSVNVSRNTRQSTSIANSNEAVGSGIVGANNVNIVATGGDKASNIRAIGSTIAAGNTVNLAADNAITLQASQNTNLSTNQNASRGASVGVTVGGGAQNGVSIQLGVTNGRGQGNQNDIGYNGTQVSGGKAVNINSGGDLNMRGATVEANRVTADVGGNLNIETLQDLSVGQSRQSSSGANLSLCIPPICYGAVATVSGSAASAKANGVFVSPAVQSGIKAGDGGFDVKVAGNTDLKGAVIESTQAAVDGKKNSFETGGVLSMSELQNLSSSSGSSYSVSGGVSLGYTTKTDGNPSWSPKEGQAPVPPTGGAGVGRYSGNEQASVTKSGISGTAGDQSVRTGDTSSAGTLVKDWNTQAIVKDVQAQAQLTQEFGQKAAREIGTYADKKYNELRASDPTEAAKWAEGGEYRVALHTAAGALGGGVAGALGAGASAALMPRIGEAIAQMGLATPVEQALGAVTAAAIGGMAGGSAGAASAYNVDINNRQLHPNEAKRIQDLAGGDPIKEARLTAAACALVRCADGVPSSAPEYAYLVHLQSAGRSMADEMLLLNMQTEMQSGSEVRLFDYGKIDSAKDWAGRTALASRAIGAAQGLAGTLGVAGSVALCTTGLGCVAGAVGGTVSADYAQAGIKQAATGQGRTTYGQQVLESLGLSPDAAAYSYAALGVAPVTLEGMALIRAASAAAQYNSLARASYSNFSTSGVSINAATMGSPSAQSLISEIRAASPGLSEATVNEIAAGLIASGKSLPSVGVAAPGSLLVKVVPRGDGVSAYSPYWMSPEQARVIAAMSPAEAGIALGLPAAQAAKIFKDGMDFYAIAAHAGSPARIFVSDIAPTIQGGVRTAPAARQVLVPNRSAWSPAVQINPRTLESF